MKTYKYIFLLWLFVFMGSFNGWGQSKIISPGLPDVYEKNNTSHNKLFMPFILLPAELTDAHERNDTSYSKLSTPFILPSPTLPDVQQNYHPPPSTGNLIGDIFIISFMAFKQNPNQTCKSSKPLFLYDFGFSFLYGNDVPGIVCEFNPRINIVEGKMDWSVSLGANAGVGAFSGSSAGSGSSGGTLSAELSTTGRFNLGFGSKNNAKSKIGFFAGTGIGYSYLQMTYSSAQGYSGSQDFNNAFGLLCESGISFKVDEDSGRYYGLGIKASYLFNSIKGYGNVLGLTIIMSVI